MKKVENFINALKNLEDIYKYHEPYDNVTLTGLIGLFEMCFEQSWKAMKELLAEQGMDESVTGSPKMIIKAAYSSGLISDGELWQQALVSRNNVITHAYNKAIAIDIINKTKAGYVGMFKNLEKEMTEKWI